MTYCVCARDEAGMESSAEDWVRSVVVAKRNLLRVWEGGREFDILRWGVQVGIYVFLVVRLEEMDYIEVSLGDDKGLYEKL
jgi:hypothetical protein